MIKLKTLSDIKTMSKGGRIASFAMKEVAKNIKPGITTLELDKIANRIIKARGACPSFLGYQGFPASICVSINDQLVHGIPSRQKICSGDIVKVDLGVFYEGFHTDMARTYIVGHIKKEEEELVMACQKALNAAISLVEPGNTVGDIEHATGKTLKSSGLSPVMSLSGHGVGRDLHEEPSIFCDGLKRTKEKLVPGMVIAIEPMATAGSSKVRKGSDGWTIVTADGSLSVHFEDTVAVTDRGHRVLTRHGKPDNIFL